jgi:hypothetical protein
MNSRPELTVVVLASLFLGCFDLSGMCLSESGRCDPPAPPGPCGDSCSPEGSSQCDGNRGVQVCQMAAGGCLTLVPSSCPDGQLCAGTACTDLPVAWEAMAVPSPTWDLAGVWGQSASDVFAVGNVIIHFDGVAWSIQATGPNADLRLADVWGSSGTDVFAVGASGTILHYDGVAWTPQASGTTYDLRSVWGSSGRDVFVAGGNSILHYDGTAWSTLAATPEAEFTALWGDTPTTIFALGIAPSGYRAYLYDGAAWNLMADQVQANSLWGSSPADVYAVGLGGRGVHHYDGRWWSQTYPGNAGYENAAVGGTSGANVFVVGNRGSVLRFNGSSWQTQNSGTYELLTDVWGDSAADVFIVGNKGTVLRRKP